jgi:hypothetical protein
MRLVTSGYFDLSGDPDLAAMAGQDPDLMAMSGGLYQVLGNELMTPDQVRAYEMQRGQAYKNVEPSKWREAVIGFPLTTIAAGATVDIPVQPQVIFRGERLTIPSDIAGQIIVQDLKVGKDSQFASVGGVPGRAFDERATGGRLRMDTAQISQQVVLRITNIGGAPVAFNAAITGTSLEL